MITLDITIHKAMLDFSIENKQKCIADIELYFSNNDWCKEAPPYQTWPVLFERVEQHWVDLKTKILKEVSNFYPVQNLKSKAWAYVNLINDISSKIKSKRWHNHKRSLYSAVFYLDVSEDAEGTEFMDFNENVYRPKIQQNMLLCFDSKVVHRPPLWDGFNQTKNRYVIAIDYWN